MSFNRNMHSLPAMRFLWMGTPDCVFSLLRESGHLLEVMPTC